MMIIQMIFYKHPLPLLACVTYMYSQYRCSWNWRKPGSIQKIAVLEVTQNLKKPILGLESERFNAGVLLGVRLQSNPGSVPRLPAFNSMIWFNHPLPTSLPQHQRINKFATVHSCVHYLVRNLETTTSLKLQLNGQPLLIILI